MTEVSLPPAPDENEDAAFKVLNNDNLPTTLITDLKQKLKPNGIVLPIRHVKTELEHTKTKNFTKSNGFISDKIGSLKKHFSNSHGQLNNHFNGVKINIEDLENHGLGKDFTKALDAKLRSLQKEEKHVEKKKNGENNNNNCKPRFVTTVKKGEFLSPPLEVAALLGLRFDDDSKKEEKKVYAYASHPRVLDRGVRIGHKARCEAAAKAAASIACSVIQEESSKRDNFSNHNNNKKNGDAAPPYQNLMFERRIARGSNFAHPPMTTQKWNPNFAYARSFSKNGDGESAAARAAEARRRAMARKKAQTQQLRGAMMRLSSPPPVHGRKHENIQTETYLEELWENPDVADVTTQTDLFLNRPVSPFFVPSKIGVDVETQIFPGDLFDFDLEVQPILEVLVGKTIEQALIEVLEEEELAALKEQQRRFTEKHSSELAESQRLLELERRLDGEKNRRYSEYEEGMRCQKDLEERIAGAVLMQGYMADLLPSVLEGLEDEGFLTDNIKQNIDESFIPWLMKEVTTEMQEMVSSRDILTDIVREILENRAEIYKALNDETKEDEEEEGATDQDIPLIEHIKLKQEIDVKEELGDNINKNNLLD